MTAFHLPSSFLCSFLPLLFWKSPFSALLRIHSINLRVSVKQYDGAHFLTLPPAGSVAAKSFTCHVKSKKKGPRMEAKDPSVYAVSLSLCVCLCFVGRPICLTRLYKDTFQQVRLRSCSRWSMKRRAFTHFTIYSSFTGRFWMLMRFYIFNGDRLSDNITFKGTHPTPFYWFPSLKFRSPSYSHCFPSSL